MAATTVSPWAKWLSGIGLFLASGLATDTGQEIVGSVVSRHPKIASVSAIVAVIAGLLANSRKPAPAPIVPASTE